MKKILILGLALLSINVVFGQLKSINGTITGFNKYPLQNIVIIAKKTKTKALTDEKGEFSIQCKNDDVLIIESKSCITKKINVRKVTDSLKINLVFKKSKKGMEYAVAYGIISEKNLTYAISNLSDENNDFSSYFTVYELIKGKFPTIIVTRTNQIIIRGVQSASNKSQNIPHHHGGDATAKVTENYGALVIVDGIPVKDLDYLDPSNVKSIDILKDASASIYGARGGNGVVVIKTK